LKKISKLNPVFF